jgi:hypothetical protein
VGHHQQHHIEPSGVASVDRGRQMAVVKGIEGAPEEADAANDHFVAV